MYGVALVRKLRTAGRLPHAHRALALTAIALTAAVRIALWTVPFRWIKRVVEACGPALFPRRKATRQQVRWAVRLASRYVPRATCLTQALTAHMLLGWAGLECRTRIGVRRERDIEAHAWVECGGRILIGGQGNMQNYSPMLTLERRSFHK
jgi:hypothetical protein